MTVELPLEAGRARGWVRVPFHNPAWLTLAPAGDMRDPARRDPVLRAMHVDPSGLCMVRQIHSRQVLLARDLVAAGSVASAVTGPSPQGRDALSEGDGIVSGPGGPPLAVGVADCIPIYIADPVTGAYGVLHSGWRGTGILREGIGLLRRAFGSRPADLLVLLGPCISVESYEVDAARGEEYAVWGEGAVVHRANRTYLDMRAANLTLARSLGVGTVGIVDHCTYRTPVLGSFRRQRTEGYTGMLAIIASA